MQKIYHRLSSLFIALTLIVDGGGIVFLLVSRGAIAISPELLRFGFILNALAFLLFLVWSSSLADYVWYKNRCTQDCF